MEISKPSSPRLRPISSEAIAHGQSAKEKLLTEEKIVSLDDFTAFLLEEPHFRLSQASAANFESLQMVLAFIIERMTQLNPEEWKDEIKEIQNKITEIRQSHTETIYPETTWLLKKIFLNLYKNFVITQRLEATKAEDIEVCEFVFRSINSSERLAAMMERLKQPTGIVGLDYRFIPPWYTEHAQKKG